MLAHSHGTRLGLVLAFAATACAARAEITTIEAAASVEILEFKAGVAGDSDFAQDSFPGTTGSLPVQVITRLDADSASGAVGAAQVADPTLSLTPNPEEFAINLAMFSDSSDTTHDAEVIVSQTRAIVFRPGELDAASAAGDVEELFGRLFIDGALGISSSSELQSLSGAEVRFDVRVDQTTSDGESQQVFSGAVQLLGQADGSIVVLTGGGFPTDSLILTDLSAALPGSESFQVLILPNLEMNYVYTAVVDEPFELTATLTASARSLPGGTGVTAVIGAPTDSLTDVLLSASPVDAFTTKLLTAVQRHRSELDSPLPAGPLPTGLCGALGLGMLPLALACWPPLRRIRRQATR